MVTGTHTIHPKEDDSCCCCNAAACFIAVRVCLESRRFPSCLQIRARQRTKVFSSSAPHIIRRRPSFDLRCVCVWRPLLSSFIHRADICWAFGERNEKQSTRHHLSISSREVDEARWPHTCSRPCAFEKKNEKKTPKHTTKSTAARQRRPPRDGVRRNTSYALAHAYPFSQCRVCGNRPRTAIAISENSERYR